MQRNTHMPPQLARDEALRGRSMIGREAGETTQMHACRRCFQKKIIYSLVINLYVYSHLTVFRIKHIL
jgi:hypothetical protein